MAIKLPTKFILLALLIAFAGVLTLGWYWGSSKSRSALNRLETAQNTISFQKAKIGQDSVFLVQTKQALVSEREARKSLELTNKDLRAMNIKHVNEINRLNLRIDTLLSDVSHTGQIITIRDSQIANLKDSLNVKYNLQKAILLPFTFDKQDKWLTLAGLFDSQGKLDINLDMKIDVDVITGIDREKKPTCVLKTDNPYIKTIGLASYKTDPPKIKHYAIGLQVGYKLTLEKDPHFTPYVGFGLDLTLFRF
jgi:hypothetical protein